ncbi:MAG: MarR family EPS-associated transcriptional regulator [Helicobacteraceae bacterium CG2_30_36_10]|nr:MAG: MarR family EPS-associated transcriptional regulator [Helicobacteraceae bacterium CG2_30_36_10]
MNYPNFPESEAFSILRNIESYGTQKSLADSIGYSVGKVNYILKALKDKGLLKCENFINSKNKKGYRYLLTEEGFKQKLALTEKFVQTKKKEYEELQRELEQMRRKND